MNPTKSDNDEREQRILSVASDLIAHYGYDKTTVSDIAREAGISKGAIYLHFDSKDALFEALLQQELRAYSTRWLELLEADEKGGTLGGMYKNTLYALHESPLMSAFFRQDTRILGSYLHQPDNFFRRQQDQDARFIFAKIMQDASLIRQDVDARVLSHIMDMLAYGLVSMADFKAEAQIPPIDALIEGIAVMMDRAFTPDHVDSETGKSILRQMLAPYVDTEQE
ncbi:MAG: TetR/AcrR family transcriptional regulator [Anaerolineae bacterium]